MPWLQATDSNAQTMTAHVMVTDHAHLRPARSAAGMEERMWAGHFYTFLISLPNQVAQDIAARILDAMNVPEPDDINRCSAVINHAISVVRAACAGVTALPAQLMQEQSLVRPDIEGLNHLLGHDTTRAFRVNLYHTLADILPDDEAARLRILAALRMNTDTLKRVTPMTSLHAAFDGHPDQDMYKAQFTELVIQTGEASVSLHNRAPDFERCSGVKAAFANVTALRIQPETPLWQDTAGLKRFSQLYFTLIALVSNAQAHRVSEMFDAGPLQPHLETLSARENANAIGLLPEQAHAYWQHMPMSPVAFADVIKDAVAHDCGAITLWGGAQPIADYTANLLSPYFRDAPIATPTVDRPYKLS